MITREFIDATELFKGQGLSRTEIRDVVSNSFRLSTQMRVGARAEFVDGRLSAKLFLETPDYEAFNNPKMLEVWMEYSDAVIYSTWGMAEEVEKIISMTDYEFSNGSKSMSIDRYLFLIKNRCKGSLMTFSQTYLPVRGFPLLLYYFGLEPLTDDTLLRLM